MNLIDSPSTLNNNIVLKSSINNFAGLNISLLNTRSLYPKFDEIKHLVSGVNLDILCFVETWLSDHISDAAIEIPGYTVLRKDRKVADKKWGGGICVYIKSTLTCKLIFKYCVRSLEAVLFEVKSGSFLILVVVIYKSRLGEFCDDFENILAEYTVKYNDVIICGDFNCDPNAKKSASKKFKRVLERFGCTCQNTEPTHFTKTSSSLLDLVITNTKSITFLNQISIGFSDHDFVFFSYDVNNCTPASSIIYRDFKNIDTTELILKCVSLPWNVLFTILEPNEKVNLLSGWLRGLFDEFVPCKRIFLKTTSPPWFNNSILSLIKLRNFIFNRWKRSRNVELYQEYKTIRNKTNNAIKNAKVQYFAKRLGATLPSKTFWNHLKSITGLSKRQIKFNNEFSADDLNDYFCNQQSAPPNTLDFKVTGICDSGFSFRNIDISDLTAVFISLKSNSTGMDGLPLKFIKILFPYIDCYILHVINSIITFSNFPLEWKHSKVIPIPKKKSTSCLSDYRPISLLPVLSKVLEKILQIQILQYLESNRMLSNYQSGYRANHSSITAVLNISDDIRRAIDDKQACTLVLLDFSKAFDKIDHQLLIKKLSNNFLFSSSASRLILSYLSDRCQTVELDSFVSSVRKIISGVPQGSVLGPFLFMMFINDLTHVINYCRYHMFADDLQIYKFCSLKDIPNCIEKVNQDIQSILLWSKTNKLDLNSTKTQCILIAASDRCTDNLPKIMVDGLEVKFSSTVNNLGIHLDKTLCWSFHVESICKRVTFLLRLLWTTTKYLNSKLRLQLVKTYILPHFLYGDIIMFDLQKQYLNYLQMMINSCIRYVVGLRKYDHISQHRDILFGCSFHDFYKFRVCLSMFKFLKYKKPYYILDKLEKLKSSRLQTIKIANNSTQLMNSSFFVRGISLWNSLPLEIKNCGTMASFRKKYFELQQSNGGV